jgi:hypothetical protein
LRDRGWQVPAYRMPANREDLVVQRVVIRNGFTRDMSDMLVRDIRRHLQWFDSQPGLRAKVEGARFHQLRVAYAFINQAFFMRSMKTQALCGIIGPVLNGRNGKHP